MLIHPFEPIYDKHSKILILGTFPSPKSRKVEFYYSHPQNAFWRTLVNVLEIPEPSPDIESRRAFLLQNRIAVWDVIYSCDIDGALDSSIKNAVANDFGQILAESEISVIYTTGKKATELYNSLAAVKTGMAAQYLPSTSPANRGQWNSPEYLAAWGAVKLAL